MGDNFKKLVDIIEENNLYNQTLDYLVDIKREIEEKEIIERALNKACYELECADTIRELAIKEALVEKEKLDKVLENICYELECAEDIIRNLRNIINSICYETQDRTEWRNQLIRDSAIELE